MKSTWLIALSSLYSIFTSGTAQAAVIVRFPDEIMPSQNVGAALFDVAALHEVSNQMIGHDIDLKQGMPATAAILYPQEGLESATWAIFLLGFCSLGAGVHIRRGALRSA